ncbi:MAG: DUF4270 family protein [Bacteroidales bacterium]|nr:DUF4270 family protein [Bacteroidales bacterium]
MSYRSSLKSAESAASKIITAILLLSIFIFNACNEDPNFIGRNILPSTDDVYTRFCDETLINSKTSIGKPILTSLNSTMLLGSKVDSIFGKSKADFMARFSIIPMTMGVERIIDSMVLTLRVSEVLGDPDFKPTIRIFELNDTLSFDTIYFSNESPDRYYDPAIELASQEINPSDTVLRIKLNNADLYDRLKDAPDTAYNDIPEFWNIFKGLYITTDDVDEGGNIFFLDIEHDYSELNVYYRDDLDIDTAKFFSLVMNFSTPRVNSYYQDYTDTRAISFMDLPDQYDTLMFISSMAGMDTKIFIEDFETWRNVDTLPVAINNAELYIPVADTLLTNESSDIYPSKLLLFTYDENDVFDYLHDFRIDANESYFGGSYDFEEDAYVFNIGMHLQSYINGDIDNLNMILVSQNNATSAERVILNSAHAKERKMELKITYTKF